MENQLLHKDFKSVEQNLRSLIFISSAAVLFVKCSDESFLVHKNQTIFTKISIVHSFKVSLR